MRQDQHLAETNPALANGIEHRILAERRARVLEQQATELRIRSGYAPGNFWLKALAIRECHLWTSTRPMSHDFKVGSQDRASTLASAKVAHAGVTGKRHPLTRGMSRAFEPTLMT